VDAAWAATLWAVEPQGLGGIALRASAGPVRDHWTRLLRTLFDGHTPWRRMPAHIADDRLLGGLDLTATLQAGRPVAQRGLLAECDGGVLLLPMAERLGAATAARLAHVLDRGEIGAEREGVTQRWPCRIGIVAFDEGRDDDRRCPVP
jgi:magnesium chelatase subunit D